MREFLLYISGICYGAVEIDAGRVRIRRLHTDTARMGDYESLTEEWNRYYLALTKINIRRMADHLDSYEKTLAAQTDTPSPDQKISVQLDDHTRYISEDGSWYMQRDVKFPVNILLADEKIRGFLCPNRESVSILIEPGYEDATILKTWKKAYPHETIYPVKFAGTYHIHTRDDTLLATDVYLPYDGNIQRQVPVILVRTPYGKEENHDAYDRYVQRGYGVVIQDVRGRNESEGEWMPNYHEVEDGDDTITWIANQPWSDGSVGMIGGSYLGYVQWAAAASGNPHLKALVSIVCAGSAFVDLPRRGGSFTSGMMAWAFAVSQKRFHPELMERGDWEEVLNIRPLSALTEKALGYRVPFMERWLNEKDYNHFWKKSDWKARSSGARIPALIMSGWFDDNGMGTTEALELTHDYPEGTRKVILGPWQHSGNTRYDLHALSLPNNALRFDLDYLYLQWFDKYLKGIDNGIDRTPPVEYYTIGENQWKTAANWPAPQTRQAPLYLTSGGHANTSSGDGTLLFTPPEKSGLDAYDYDPQNPSIHIIDMSENELEVPEDYTQEEKREDILCYSTPPLEHELTVTGDITAFLYVSSNAPDTDFIVRITDVDEHGRSVKLADGVLSARYRSGFEKTEYMETGVVYPLTIRTTKISFCFPKGHRLRLTITSSAKNFLFPNSNTTDGYDSETSVVAHNAIYYGKNYPSKIIVRIEDGGNG